MDELLQEISNLTKGAQDKVFYLKDSQTQAQKSSPGNTFSSLPAKLQYIASIKV